mgnify:CR=1 FL=1
MTLKATPLNSAHRAAGAKMVEMLQSLLAGTPPERLQEIWQPVLLPGATVGRCPE